MIDIKFTLDKEGYVETLEMTGHAGYGEHGYDIVCAAVSSQVISVENSLQALLGIPVETEVNEIEGGYLKLRMPKLEGKPLEAAHLLMQHLHLAFDVISESYPEFVHVQDKPSTK
ncbi:ribosomal-processing cysteine protease Prp [Suicoccus acidiformans]|uniref:Ribosomal processing cysteine protease Prp n=1 Tax=Suicoccus acidiformans TaxID=2036206 RepID=A0A347WLB2_9LACT|nr:ribosomal-processing cysteine protease Prp [Suicoccus acidiformans]AXY25869.1 ribosomal-processing cysteine protease Prp [Suicoccus acidiformans]